MATVSLVSDLWTSGPVKRVRSTWSRFRGLRSYPQGVFIRTKSVHAFGSRKAFRAIGLTRDLEVAVTRVLLPGEVAMFRGCRYVLELPVEHSHPAVGTRLHLNYV